MAHQIRRIEAALENWYPLMLLNKIFQLIAPDWCYNAACAEYLAQGSLKSSYVRCLSTCSWMLSGMYEFRFLLTHLTKWFWHILQIVYQLIWTFLFCKLYLLPVDFSLNEKSCLIPLILRKQEILHAVKTISIHLILPYGRYHLYKLGQSSNCMYKQNNIENWSWMEFGCHKLDHHLYWILVCTQILHNRIKSSMTSHFIK